MQGEPPYSIIEDIEIELGVQHKWQRILDLISEIMQVSAVLVMRVHEEDIEVFVKDSSKENIYRQAERTRLESGLYCETVMSSRHMLSVPNALKDKKWKNNPDAALGMIAYLGFPVLWPNGEVFGTLCVLDRKEREFTDQDSRLIGQFAEVLQDDLAAILDRISLEKENRQHLKYEAELRLSEERFRKIFDSSASAILITSYPDGKIVNANESFMTMFGVTHDQIVGKTDTELNIHISDEQKQAMAELLTHGRVVDYLLNLWTPSGVSKHMLISIEVMRIANQECLISTLTDITSVLQLEQNFRVANERFELATRAAQLGIWDWNIESGVLFLDARVSGMYGIGNDALMTTYEAWLGYLHPEDISRCEAVIRTALETSVPLDTEFRIIRPDGTVRHIKSFGNVIRSEEGTPVRMVGINLDFTEKKLADIALEKNDLRLQRAQALAHVGNWEIDLKTRKMWASREAFRVYGLHYEDGFVPLETAQARVLTEDRSMMDRALTCLIQENAAYDVVFRIQRQEDGNVRTLHSVAERVVSLEGMPLRVIGVVQDITEFSRAQQALAESEAKYKALFNETSAVHLIVEVEEGRIIDANIAARRYYGYPADKLVGKHITALNTMMPEEAHKKLRKIYKRQLDRFEAKHRLADQSLRDIEAFSGPIDIGGRQCVSSIIHDITDRKRAERELVESEARFRMFVESAPDGVFVQTNGCFAYVNRKTLQLFGAESEKDLLGKRVPEFFAEEYRKKVAAGIKKLNENGQPTPLIEEAILRMDGSRLEVEVSAVPIRYNGYDGGLVFMRDIAKRRLLEKAKQEMEIQLQQKQRLESIGLLAGGVAHEINNPLSGIINYAQLISDAPAEAISEYAQEIMREGQRIAEIVRNLLKFSRHEKQSHSPAYIEDIVDETLSLIRTIIRHDQITLEINIPPDIPSVKCRSQQIQQVLMNLFTNARDALNVRYEGFHEDKIMRLNCTLIWRDGRRWIRLTVEDHGAGIPDDIRDKVFDPFFTTKPRGEGTGLGLSISHGIVKDHHGELYFISEPGRFTRAILELPVDNGWDLNRGTSNA